MTAALQAAEICRRHQALMSAFWRSRGSQPQNKGSMAVAPSATIDLTLPETNDSPPAAKLAALFCRSTGNLRQSAREIRDWSHAAGVILAPGRLDVGFVNQARRAAGLPLFILQGPSDE